MSEELDKRLELISNDFRGTTWKLELFGQTIWISFTRKGCGRGGDIHDGLQFNIVIKGEFLIKELLPDGKELLDGITTGQSIIIPKNVPHVFIALEDTLMIEWHDHKLPPYEKKRFYEPYRELCKTMNIDELNKWYYFNRPIMYWMGVECNKIPTDLWIYHRLIFTIKPDFVIESGTGHGGTTLFISNLLDLFNHGKIITIDINGELCSSSLVKTHPRIIRIIGSSIDSEIINKVSDITRSIDSAKILVILDSDHHYSHVKKEMELYAPFVSIGSYLVVEDTNVVDPLELEEFKKDGGPLKAVLEFLKEHDEFNIDKQCEKFYITLNPNGYLKRIK